MKETRPLVWTALLLGVLLATGAALAQPVVHQATGIAFPDDVAGFTRYRTHDFERTQAGSGYGYEYRRPGMLATVYIYTFPFPAVPTDVNDPLLVSHFDQTLEGLKLAAKMQGGVMREPLRGTTMPIETDSGSVPVRWSMFILSGPGGAANSRLYIWPAHGHLFKIRMTASPMAGLDLTKSPEPGELQAAAKNRIKVQDDFIRFIVGLSLP